MSLRGWCLIWGTLLLALTLQIVPLMDRWLIWRPDWLELMLIYWCFVAPRRVGVAHGFVFGLLLDLAQGSPLGQSALVLTLLVFLCTLAHRRMRAYSLAQQALMVLLLLLVAQLLEQWLMSLFGPFTVHLAFLLPAVIGAVLWPWFYLLFQRLNQRLKWVPVPRN